PTSTSRPATCPTAATSSARPCSPTSPRATGSRRRTAAAPESRTRRSQTNWTAQDELVGPVFSVLTFRTPDEAVERANNTPYGLSAGVWTEKGSRILWMGRKIRAGGVLGKHFNPVHPT